MQDYIDLGQTTPRDEPCAQVGDAHYLPKARIEAAVYISQLKRTFGECPNGSCLQVVRCPHDFGVYLDIRYCFDDEEQAHVKYLLDIETGCATWDDQARRALRACGYAAPRPERLFVRFL